MNTICKNKIRNFCYIARQVLRLYFLLPVRIVQKVLAKKKALRLLEAQKIIKLHLGCGRVYKESWVNIDNNSDCNIVKLDLNWDLRYPLPFPPDSVDYIFNEHFLEHLTVEEGQKSLQDFLRVLKPNGVMRIAMPDLESLVELYRRRDWEEHAKLCGKFGLEYVRTPSELLNLNFRKWGHKWLYDWEELERRLKEAGAVNIKRCSLRVSDHPDLNMLETRDESTLIAEITK